MTHPAPRPTTASRLNVDTLIHAEWIIPVDPENRILERHSLAVRSGRIEAILPTAEARQRYRAEETVDLPGHALIPGLINAHTHAAMTLLRGIADDLELMDWLENHIFPAEAKLVDEDFVRWGTRLACLEMLRGGITTFADMYYFEDVVAEEVDRCGMRAVVVYRCTIF